jgi:hypothetical protein
MDVVALFIKRDESLFYTDGPMALHELIHHTHVKRKVGVVMKIDFEKAYNKINWDSECCVIG